MNEKIEELKKLLESKTKENMKLQHEIQIKQGELQENGRECFKLQSQIQILEEMRNEK
jgi:hypothetical protein